MCGHPDKDRHTLCIHCQTVHSSEGSFEFCGKSGQADIKIFFHNFQDSSVEHVTRRAILQAVPFEDKERGCKEVVKKRLL